MPPRPDLDGALPGLEPAYTIVREISRGSRSVLYLAQDNELGREVAIKVVPSRLARNRAATAGFRRWVRALARLQHHHIVKLFEVVPLEDGRPAAVMRYVAGETLRDVLQREGRLSPDRVERVLREVGDALTHAHERNIVNGQVHPDHVIFDEDTGSAMLLGPWIPVCAPEEASRSAPPEQMIHATLERQKDLYLLALLGWTMLGREAGAPPPLLGATQTLASRLWRVLGPALEGRFHDLGMDTGEFVSSLARPAHTASMPPAAPARWMQRLQRVVPPRTPAEHGGPVVRRNRKTAARALILASMVLLSAGTLLVAVPRLTPPEAAADPRAAPADLLVLPAARAAAPAPALPVPEVVFDAPEAPGAAGAEVAQRPADDAQFQQGGPTTSPSRQVRLVAGGMHTCALANDGETLCWGGNDQGQLGRDGSVRAASPIPIAGDLRLATISAGVAHTCGVTAQGDAYCWGGNERGQLGGSAGAGLTRVDVSQRFRFVRAGMLHTCGLTRDGRVFCWGDNSVGQLGASTAGTSVEPREVAAAGPFRALAGSWNHTCALRSDGRILCWGHNGLGQLGDGSRTDRPVPTPTAGDTRFRAVAAGSAHSCALARDGTAFCWGRNTYGELGDGSAANRAQPARVRGGHRFESIGLGSAHSCGLTARGSAYCWGRNNHGQLGDGTTTDRAFPVAVAGGLRFASLDAAGAAHTCGTTVDGGSFCWGQNVEGQLGDGTQTQRTVPTQVRLASTGRSERSALTSR